MEAEQLHLPSVNGYLDDLAHALFALVDQYGYDAVTAELARIGLTRQAVPSAPARWTDPETSQRAGPREADLRRFSDRSRQAKLLRIFMTGDFTDQQAAGRVVGMTATPSAFEGCRRRCSDLRAVGYIADSGRRRKNTGSDDESVVWTITEVGRKAVRNLDHYGWSR